MTNEVITYRLDQFEGPLDLLLTLIDKNKVDIADIPIASIFEQYMLYIEEARKLDLEVACEFIVMAMNASGVTQLNPVSSTVFADDADIPTQMKSYVSAAYDLGYINGLYVDGKLCFEPNRAITRAECAVVIANMLDAATPTVKPVFSDGEDIPTWAEASINSLCYMGVMQSNTTNNISPTASLTRGDAAQILSNFIAVDN